MKNYLKRPEDVSNAVRLLRKNGVRVGLPMQTPDGEMVFLVDNGMITAGQILELSNRKELHREGIRRLTEAANREARELAAGVLGQSMNEVNETLRILVVDDSSVSRKLAEFVLAGKPYEVFFAEHGHQALKLVESRRPHIVIIDGMMPDLSGLELCQAIRNKLKCADTYLILLTSNSGEAPRAAGYAAGADAYLTKPLRSDDLLGQIRIARSVLKARGKVTANTSIP
jgi:CheY-like chemotaxis protein